MAVWPFVTVAASLCVAMAVQSLTGGVHPTLAFIAGGWVFASVDLLLQLRRDSRP